MTSQHAQTSAVSRRTVLIGGTVAVGGLNLTEAAAADGTGATTQTADISGQGPSGPVVAADGATLRRSDNGVKAKVKMPTPESGTYAYPDPEKNDTVSEPGHPEGFTLWVFVFDDPEAEDFTGAFLGAGHIVGGDTLTLSGHTSTNTDPFVGERMENPRGAKVHSAHFSSNSQYPYDSTRSIHKNSATKPLGVT